MIKVGVLGARGRMGAEVVKAVSEAADLELVAALDLGDSLDQLKSNGSQVVVDLRDVVTGFTVFGVTPDKFILDMKYYKDW